MRKTLSYWRYVVWRALQKTWQSAGFWTLWAIPISGLMGWGIHAYLARSPEWKSLLGEPMAEWWLFIIYALVPLGVLAIGAALFNIFVGPPQLHSEQLSALNDARTELACAVEEIKAKLPHITGEVFSLASARFEHIPSKMVRTIVSVWVMLRNTGEPSIAEDFTLHAMTVDGRELHGMHVIFSDDSPINADKVLSPTEETLTHPAEQLALKTLVPIPKGGAIGGTVIAAFPIEELEALRVPGCRFGVTFFDVHRNRLFCEYTIKEKVELEPGTAGFIPGRPLTKANHPHVTGFAPSASPDSKQ